MSQNRSKESILAEAEQIARVWAANPDFSLGALTLAQFQAFIAELRADLEQLQQLRTQQTALTNGINAKSANLRDLITRSRSGFRAVYGPNSTQYEQSGGTRTADRKRPTRKRKPGSDGSK